MRIKILAVSDSDKHFLPVIEEYIKRLGKTVEIVNIKPERNGTRQQMVNKDTLKIIEKIEKLDSYKILLSINGENIDTMKFCDIFRKNNDLTFVIGGPYGLDEELINKFVDLKISFGKMTFPHGLAKSMILEQIYRVDSILKGREYHY